MKVISKVKDKTNVKLGPQDFLVCTLQQLAEKLDDSDAFNGQQATKVDTEPTASASSTEAAEENSNTSVTDTSAKPVSEGNANKGGKGLIGKLKGFWD